MRKAVERRKFVIRENEIDASVLESGQELGARLDAGDFTDEISASRSPQISSASLRCPPAEECGEETSRHLLHAARRRLIDHRPEDTQFLDGIDKLVKIDRLYDVRVHPEW